MIPSLFLPRKHILILKVIFYGAYNVPQKFGDIIYCNICKQFQIYLLETLKYLIRHTNKMKPVSVRIITPRSAHCEQSCQDKLAAACHGTPRAWGRRTVWKCLACYCSSSGTKVTQLNTTACWLSSKTTCSVYTFYKRSPILREKNVWPWNAIHAYLTESLQRSITECNILLNYFGIFSTTTESTYCISVGMGKGRLSAT